MVLSAITTVSDLRLSLVRLYVVAWVVITLIYEAVSTGTSNGPAKRCR